MDQHQNHNLFCPSHIKTHRVVRDVAPHQNYLDICPGHERPCFPLWALMTHLERQLKLTIFPPLRCWESLLLNSGFQCAGNGGGTLARAPVLQKVPPEKSVPTNVLEVPEHQTPNSFHKQTDLNDALTMSVRFLPCLTSSQQNWLRKAPSPEFPTLLSQAWLGGRPRGHLCLRFW